MMIVKLIDRINVTVGRIVSWFSLLLVILIVLDVALRYFFQWSGPATFELEWHLFAMIFLLSAGWTLKEDRHVRVDVFYHRLAESRKALVNLIGSVFFLIPFCVVAIAESIPFVISSFEMGETSTDPGGLPMRFLIKSAIPVGFLLLGLQGISIVMKTIILLRSKG